MKKVLSVFALAALLVACGGEDAANDTANGDDTTAAAAPAEIEYVVAIADGDGEMMADLSVSGMSCEQMCVGKVRETLTGMTGVTECEFPDFSGDNEFNHVMVKFDPAVISEQEMISAVNDLKHYRVSKVVIDEDQPATETEPATTGEEPVSGESSTTMETSSYFSLPNPMDLLRGFFNALG